MMNEMINKKDAILYIDIYCYSCKRLVAISNTQEIDGRRYCEKCLPPKTINELGGNNDK